MRKRIKVTGFSDWDSMFYNNLLSIPVLAVFSIVLEDWGSENLVRNLYVIFDAPSSSGPAARLLMPLPFPAHLRPATFSCLLSRFRVQLRSGSRILRHGVYVPRVVQPIGAATRLLSAGTTNDMTSMVGALNKLPVAASGMLFFGDAVTFGSVSAIGVGFFAGIVYAIAKNNQKKMESGTQANTIIPLSNRKL
jgi:GDP-mannose transporter